MPGWAQIHLPSPGGSGGLSVLPTTGLIIGILPTKTLPVVPSTEIHSPSRTTTPPASITRRSRSMRMEEAPTTQGTPNWRATTAAWEVAPPSLVKMPLGCQHAVHIIRLGERANHDDFLLFFLGHPFGGVSIKVNLANGSAWTGVHALGIHPAFNFGFLWRLRQTAGGAAYPPARGHAGNGFFFTIRPSPAMSTATLTAAWAVRLP